MLVIIVFNKLSHVSRVSDAQHYSNTSPFLTEREVMRDQLECLITFADIVDTCGTRAGVKGLIDKTDK